MDEKLTPLMQQYADIRREHPEALLFFQVGDFYELFFEDAKIVSSFLAITLTKRGKSKGEDIPLCGVPVHALNHYLVKLIKGGFKIAICDQVSKPQPGTVVERKVTRVLTPGTLTDTSMLDEKNASYLCAFYPGATSWGLVFTELLTAQVFATTVPHNSLRMLESEIIRFFPDEVILFSKSGPDFAAFFKQLGYAISYVPQVAENAVEGGAPWIEQQFDKSSAQKLYGAPELLQTLEILYVYLKKNHESALANLKSIQFYEPDDFLLLDSATQKNLELVKNSQDGGRKNSLLAILDGAKTAMGSRLIKKWLTRPLVQKKAILQRQEVVAYLRARIELLQMLEELFVHLTDLERIVGRIALRRAQLQDYLGLKQTLFCLPALKKFLFGLRHLSLASYIHDRMYDGTELAALLELSLNQDHLTGQIIKKEFDYELDRLRNLVENAQQEVVALESQEIERTGITSLRIRYTDLFGYAFEITKANIDAVPAYFILQQNLSNKNRYVTPELKALEAEIIHARQSIGQVEMAVFDRIKVEVEKYLTPLRHTAQALAHLDALFGFAKVAYHYNYVVPVFNDEQIWNIKKGRHPVVEQSLSGGFVANDTTLSDDESVVILTGSNMGGKSTYLRQVALITLMAQCGSLVPAESASLPIVDSIFTRIGSGDNVAQGKSTFLVEMEEVAVICAQSSKKSLIILDEVGRGTSTFDGMAIAHAVIKYIYAKIGARTLFATHYHELAALQQECVGIVNYHLACKKTAQSIAFLHTLVPGAAPGSFGIEVAKLAGLPTEVTRDAEVILRGLEKYEELEKNVVFMPSHVEKVLNVEGFEEFENLKKTVAQQSQILAQLNDVCLDSLSPRGAFDLVWRLKAGLK